MAETPRLGRPFLTLSLANQDRNILSPSGSMQANFHPGQLLLALLCCCSPLQSLLNSSHHCTSCHLCPTAPTQGRVPQSRQQAHIPSTLQQLFGSFLSSLHSHLAAPQPDESPSGALHPLPQAHPAPGASQETKTACPSPCLSSCQ